MSKNLIALKPYLESVKEHCSRLSNDELTELILGLAKEVPAKRRIAFLETLDRLSEKQPSAPWDEEILGMIEALKGDIKERAASIEDGSYYDDYYEEYRRGRDYDDSPPDTLSVDQKDQLESYFEEAAQLFLSGQIEAARKVYASLFELLDGSDEDDEEDYLYISDYSLEVEMREAKARYFRCVYETTPLPNRVPAMLAAMNLRARLSEFRFDVYENNHPMFCDVIDSRQEYLAGWDQFLPRWKDALSRQSSDRAAMLLLEAVYLLEGLEGVQSLVCAWGGRQPRAWLFWIRVLALENDWQGVAALAEEALSVVDHRKFRALIAEKLIEAGEKINRRELVLAGWREAFFSVPGETHLLRMIEEADMQNLRDAELERTLEFVSSKEKNEKALLAKMLLMAGRIDTAFEKAGKIRALGWSYGERAGAVLFGGILSLLCLDRIEEAVTVKGVLQRYADGKYDWCEVADDSEDGPEDGAGSGTCISAEILRGLRGTTVSADEASVYLLWAVKTGRRRIEQIVSNKHRGAYDRAAEILGSLAECYLLNGEKDKSRGIIDEYRNQKFNRHSAFRRELGSVIACSELLCFMYSSRE